jgi:hypothetical protein
MQLAPGSAISWLTATVTATVNLEARAIDEDVNWSIGVIR